MEHNISDKNKYWYWLRLSILNCNFKILINDVPIIEVDYDEAINSQLPLNTFLINGPNSIDVRLYPMSEEKELRGYLECKISIIKYTNENAENSEIVFSTNVDTNNTEVIDNTIISINSFSTILNFKNPIWLNSKKIKINDETVKLLEQKTNELWSIFNSKNIDRLKDLIGIREQNIAQSLYQDENSRLDEVITTFKSYMNDSQLELYPYNVERCKPELYGFGRLIRLRSDYGYFPIIYCHDDEYTTIDMSFYFMLTDDDELIIAR